MRVTTRTNLAVRVLMICANNMDRLITTAEISGISNSSAHHAARVVHELQAMGVISTLRGRGGGIRLEKPVDQISIGMIMRRFESDIPLAECFNPDTNTCPLAKACRLRSYLKRALEAFFHELDMVTLEDLVRGNCGLTELLSLRPEAPETCTAPTA